MRARPMIVEEELMEHRFKMAAAEDEKEGSASVLSRFTASRVRDAQIELTREGLRHTSTRRGCA